MYREHRIGAIVRVLRERRIAGATLPDLLNFMSTLMPGDRNGAINYIGDAFCVRSRLGLALMTPSPTDEAEPHMLQRAEGFIDGKRATWETQPIPELMRIRDYLSFLQFSKENE